MQVKVARKSLAGKSAFEVPLIINGASQRPRAPRHIGFSAFYLGRERCMLVCGGASANYLRARKYARFMGETSFDPHAEVGSGLSHLLTRWPEGA